MQSCLFRFHGLCIPLLLPSAGGTASQYPVPLVLYLLPSGHPSRDQLVFHSCCHLLANIISVPSIHFPCSVPLGCIVLPSLFLPSIGPFVIFPVAEGLSVPWTGIMFHGLWLVAVARARDLLLLSPPCPSLCHPNHVLCFFPP